MDINCNCETETLFDDDEAVQGFPTKDIAAAAAADINNLLI